MLLFCFEFNKCNLNPKAVQSNLDYPDLFPWSCFVMNINKMRSWKVETIKSTLILPNVCLKHCFNLFRFEKAWAAWDELLLWCIQLNSDWLNSYVTKGMSCLIMWVMETQDQQIVNSQSCLQKESGLFSCQRTSKRFFMFGERRKRDKFSTWV